MRSKAYWGYDEEFLERVRPILTYSEDDLLSARIAARRFIFGPHAPAVAGQDRSAVTARGQFSRAQGDGCAGHEEQSRYRSPAPAMGVGTLRRWSQRASASS